jgi:histidinol-phosphate aminotransferase
MYIKKKYLNNLQRSIKEKRKKHKKGIYIDRNENPIEYNNIIKQKLFKKLSNLKFGEYPELEPFYTKLAKWLNLSKENLYITEGVSGAIKSLLEAYTLPKKNNIIFPHPTFAMYPVYSEMFGLKAKKINYDKKYNLNFKKLINAIDTKTAFVFLPNPNVPIEGMLSKKQIQKILKKCEKFKCFLVLDEVYYSFGKFTGIDLIKKSKNIFVMRSFSKACGLAGLRIGYLIGAKNNIKYVSKTRAGYESNTTSTEIASFFIDHYKIILKQIKLVKVGLKYLRLKLKEDNIEFNGGLNGNYIYINLKNVKKTNFVLNYLKKNKIYVRGSWPRPFDQGFSVTGSKKIVMKKFYLNFKKALKKFKK